MQFRHFCIAVLGLCAVSLPQCAHAQGYRAHSSVEAMTGGFGPDKAIFSRGGTVRYEIMQRDCDTWEYVKQDGTSGGTYKEIEKLCAIRGGQDIYGRSLVTSMVPGQFRASLSKVTSGSETPSYTYISVVSGQAVSQAGTYYDKWLLYNDRYQVDIFYDNSLTVTQTVTLNP